MTLNLIDIAEILAASLGLDEADCPNVLQREPQPIIIEPTRSRAVRRNPRENLPQGRPAAKPAADHPWRRERIAAK